MRLATTSGVLAACVLWLGLTAARGQSPPQSVEPIDVVRTLRQAATIHPELAVASGRGIDLALERAVARPAESGVEYFVHLDPTLPRADLQLRHTVHDLLNGRVAEQRTSAPADDVLLEHVNLRRLGLSQARLRVELLEKGAVIGAGEALLGARSAPPALGPDQAVNIGVDWPLGAGAVNGWPVTFGVPFPAGGLWDIQTLGLVDDAGRDVPFQTEVTGHWAPQGAIQWVRFDVLADSGRPLRMVAGRGAPAPPPQPVSVRRQDDGTVVVDTGVARYELNARGALVQRIVAGGRTLASDQARGLYVIDQQGRTAVASADEAQVLVEASGPVTACVRIAGFYRLPDGEALARHITRMEFFAGRPEAQITHTLILTRDSNEVWFRQVGWEWSVAAGAGPRAQVNTDAADPAQVRTVPLGGQVGLVRQLQQDFPGLGGRARRFMLTQIAPGVPDDQAHAQSLLEGQRMGDWALVGGEAGALMVLCPDAARQQPKAFVMAADRLGLELFSGQAGAELDFRPAALAQRWGLEGKPAQAVAAVTSNAIGWSRTHRIVLTPLDAAAPAQQAARLALLHGQQVFALVDPWWIYRSGALGALYPRDVERFPDAERIIESDLRHFVESVPGERYTGFVDYFAGPHYGYKGRYRLTYTLLPDAWLAYARSGDRGFRRFAQGANRAFMDNYIAHWPGPGKRLGLFIGANGDTPLSNHPFYWEEQTSATLATTSDLNRSLIDYHLTGYRRAGDIARQYADHVKLAWRPADHTWRVILLVRLLTQAYTLTWDPQLRAMIEGTLTVGVYDPRSEVLLSKDRPYGSSTYKTPTDQDVFVQLHQVLGTQRSGEMAMALSSYWWDRLGIAERATGVAAHDLYQRTGDAAIAAGMDHYLRTAATRFNPATGQAPFPGFSQVARVFQGIPHAMDIVARTDADRRPTASWLHFNDYGDPVRVFVRKQPDEVVDLLYRQPDEEDESIAWTGPTGDALVLLPHAVGRTAWSGQDLYRVTHYSSGQSRLRVPKDAPGGVYEVAPARQGEHFLLSSGRHPLVFYAPGYWRPFPLRPQVPIIFNLPAASSGAAVFLEGSALLRRPDGTLMQDGQTLSGWVALPAEHVGLWQILPQEPGLIRGKGFAPFFAMGDPAFWFDPGVVDWQAAAAVEPRPAVPPPPPEVVYVPGPRPGTQALYLGERRSFQLDAAAKAGDQAPVLPHARGTIEFFLRTDWNTFDLRQGSNPVRLALATVLSDGGDWSLSYQLLPQVAGNQGPREPTHALMAALAPRQGPVLRVWRTQTLFQAGQWRHIAWVWGRREQPDRAILRLFIDGRGAGQVAAADDNRPKGVPRSLLLHPMRGAVANLRISDLPRYEADFTPPHPAADLPVDEHTLVLFSFDGSLTGCRGAGQIPWVGTLKD